jgi:nitrile hydratase
VLAQMLDGLPPQPLYRVRFLQKDVWPDYRGSANDVVEVEIFQHWLEKT